MLMSAGAIVDEAFVVVGLPLQNRGYVQDFLPHYLRFLIISGPIWQPMVECETLSPRVLPARFLR